MDEKLWWLPRECLDGISRTEAGTFLNNYLTSFCASHASLLTLWWVFHLNEKFSFTLSDAMSLNSLILCNVKLRCKSWNSKNLSTDINSVIQTIQTRHATCSRNFNALKKLALKFKHLNWNADMRTRKRRKRASVVLTGFHIFFSHL